MEIISYTKKIPSEEHFDVIVLGGGPSGIMAAAAAFRILIFPCCANGWQYLGPLYNFAK